MPVARRSPARVAARRLPALLAAALLLAAVPALADPLHTVTVDGTITADGADWVPADLVVDDTADYGANLSADFYRLWVTWDADSLYVGTQYLASNRTVLLLLDAGLQSGLTDAALLDSVPRAVSLPAGRSIDYVVAQSHGAFNDVGTPVLYRVTGPDGGVADLSGEMHAAQTFSLSPPGAKRLPAWYTTELAVAWSTLYPDGVPPHATLRLAGIVAGNADGDPAEDVAPDNTTPGETPGSLLLEHLHVSIVDIDGDGVVDPADGAVSGHVTLPADPGDVPLTVTARLVGWAGGELADPLVAFTTDPGVRDYRLGRLPSGTYDVTIAAPGYFPTTLTGVAVTAGQEVTGLDAVLEKATTIGGTLSLDGPGRLGEYVFRDPDGVVLDRGTLLPSDFPFAFTWYVSVSGTYTLEAWAETYLRQVFPIEVTAGTDVTGLDLVLQRAPRIAGAIAFASGPGAAGEILLRDAAGDTLDRATFAAPGDTFSFFATGEGTFSLLATAPTYVPAETTVTVVAGEDLTGLTVTLHRLPGVAGTIAFADGPGHAGRVVLTGDGVADTLLFTAAGGRFGPGGAYPGFYVPAGDYTLTVDADGYRLLTTTVTTEQPDAVSDAGELSLQAVVADRFRLLDADGRPIEAVTGTVSLPADGFFSPAPVVAEAVDADGRRDLFDLQGRLVDLPLTARKLDDVVPPRGDVRFLASEDVTDTIATVSASDGVLRFWMIDDAVEVLRVFVGPDVPAQWEGKDGATPPPTARLVVGFGDPRPATVVLTADRDTMLADGSDAVAVTAQLFDTAGNESRLADVPVSFLVDPGSSGRGAFTVPTVLTNADGVATAELTATGTGLLTLTAAVVVDGLTLDVRADSLESGTTTLTIAVTPGPAERWQLRTEATVAGLDSPLTVTGQLVDAYDNPVPLAGVPLQLTVDPPAAGGFADPAPVSDEAGRITALFQPAGTAGIVEIGGISGDYAVDPVAVQLRDVTVMTDPSWDQEPAAHNSFDAVDLTSVVLDNTPDALTLEIPFASNWTGLQLHVLLETGWDAAGGSRDAFLMPVNFGHEDRPDFILTSKYSANDYGDFRRWDAATGQWQWFDPASGEFTDQFVETVNIQGSWVDIGAATVRMTIPWAALGGRPDSLRAEVYVTQEDAGVKRSAFDSVPSDATLDLDFDYNDPQPGDWDRAALPVTLAQWGPTYVVRTDFPTPPAITAVSLVPDTLAAGTPFTLTAAVADAGDGVGDVVADLSAIAGGTLVRLYDDGDPVHGDLAAGDGTWSLRATVPLGSPGGERPLVVAAYDAGNVSAARDTVTAQVDAQVEIILHAEDPVGDDHGPDHPGEENMYYTYPTNSVFVPGAFDLTGLDVYMTTTVVSGQVQPMIAFAVHMVDFPDPADPETADWNPYYGELNIEKIDIMIDSGPGGATRGLPNRRVDFEPWNAWDYAIVLDGWYKAVVPSLGQNTVESWRENALRSDADIIIEGDPRTDVVTALVSPAALGNPTADDIRSWNIAVLMASHDFGGEEVLGGIRWVNEARSEWQFGGGSYTDHDPNIIDLLLIPGAGEQPGRPQQELLDYESPEAVQRLTEGLTPCAIEMTAFQDTGPPVIHLPTGDLLLERAPLRDAPVAFSLEITDDFRVEDATARFRPTTAGGSWALESAMGFVGHDLWSVDLPAAWLDTALVASPLDSARYLEFQVVAHDAQGKETVSPVTTMRILPAADCLATAAVLGGGDVALRHVDGSALLVPDGTRRSLLALYGDALGAEAPDPDSLATFVELEWEICQVGARERAAPAVGGAAALGCYRGVALALGDSASYLPLDGRLPAPLELTLHYTRDDLPDGADPNRVGIYEYTAASDRWVLVGGHVNPDAGEVTIRTDHAGTYGLFLGDELDYDPGEVISGITVSPNPFSPNGDGLYDQTTISFYLSQEATVTLEVYNIDGVIKRRLMQPFPFSGEDNAARVPRRVAGLTWDGTDENGKPVPYGVYVLRLIVTYNQAGGTRTIRSNHPVAVIR